MKPIAIDGFAKLRYLSNVKFSPAGKTACFCVTEADLKKNSYRTCIYLRKGSRVRKLTAGGKEGTFLYENENSILFPGNREEDPPKTESRWYRIRLDGGEAELAYTFPVPVSGLYPLDDGNLLVTASVVPGWEDLYRGDPKKAEAFLKAQKENADYEELTQVPWWWNGATFTKSAYESLYFYDSRKKKLRPLTQPGVSVYGVALKKERGEVYWMQTPVTPLLEFNGKAELYRMKIGQGEPEKLTRCEEGFELMGVVPMDSFLLILANNGRYGLNTDGDFYRMDYETGEISLLAVHGEAIGSSVGSDIRYGGGEAFRAEGDTLYFISTRWDSAYLYRLENGEITRVLDREGSVDCFDVHGGKILAVALFGMKGQELYDGTGKQLTRLNEAALKNVYTAQPESLNIETGGHEIHGFVLRPADYDPEKTYPVIFDIHGGPKTVYGPVYYHEMQYWAGLGYFVLFCNPTGSDGRGGFMDICGKYGTVDYEDLMAFCDSALDRYPQMDRENVFETGGSYGGFMTNWIIGHTDRFRACASQRSISNWFSFYGVSDIGVEFATDQIRADMWKSPEKLWEHSPLKYADRVKTPTLFIHSFEDYRCPIDQGYQMYTALISHGVEAKLVAFRGENHDLSRTGKPLHRIRRLKEITQWFETHRTDRKA